jgi:hypothetical protein
VLEIRFLTLEIQFLVLEIQFLTLEIQFLMLEIQFLTLEIEFLMLEIQFLVLEIWRRALGNRGLMLLITRFSNTRNSFANARRAQFLEGNCHLDFEGCNFTHER